MSQGEWWTAPIQNGIKVSSVDSNYAGQSEKPADTTSNSRLSLGVRDTQNASVSVYIHVTQNTI